MADEATHDFLAWYNPRAMRIRRTLGGLRFPPTFTLFPWLGGLLAAVLLLGAPIPSAYAGMSFLRPVASALAVIHIGNGLLLVGGSILARRLVLGALSAPLLLVTGSWLWYATAQLP